MHVLHRDRAQIGRERRVLVLQTVRLVDDHIPPRDLFEHVQVLLDHLVRGDEDVELVQERRLTARFGRGHYIWGEVPLNLADELSGLIRTVVQDRVHLGPLLKLTQPVGERGERREHEEGAADALLLPNMVQRRNRLYRLAETHLIREHDRAPIVPREEQPVQPLELIRPERVPGFEGGRRGQLLEGCLEGPEPSRRGHLLLVFGRRLLALVVQPDRLLLREERAAALPSARRIRQRSPLDEIARRQVLAVGWHRLTRRLAHDALDDLKVWIVRLLVSTGATPALVALVAQVPGVVCPVACLSLRLRLEESQHALLVTEISLELAPRHPLAVDVGEALPLDEQLGLARLLRQADQVDFLQRPREKPRPPRARDGQRGRHATGGHGHPRPVVLVVDPSALRLVKVFEVGVQAADVSWDAAAEQQRAQ